jgi:hypothetical protein
MAIQVPETIDEALAAGGRKFNGNDDDLFKYGAPLETVECANRPPGVKCAVYKCVGPWRLVAYCDHARGCTEFYEVPCV